MACQDTFDPLGASSYIAILAAEAVVFLSHLVWLARGRGVRGVATSAGPDSGESVAASAEGGAVEDVKAMPEGSRIRVVVEEVKGSTRDSEGGAAEDGHVSTNVLQSPV